MGNQFDIVKELRKYTGGTRVAYAIRYGKTHFFTIEQAYQDLTKRKVRLLCWYLKSREYSVRTSKSSDSMYFFINRKMFRISDHRQNPVNARDIDHDIIIRYDTCVIQTISNIQLLAFTPDNYEG